MGTIDDAFRAAIDKLQELAKETVNSIAEVIERFFEEWLVEEYPTLEDSLKKMEELAKQFEKYFEEKEKKDKERFFSSDQLVFCDAHTKYKKPCIDDNRPLMFWSGFV